MVLSRVRRTLRERELLLGGERVLVACSGGPDSMALLDVLSRLAPELSLHLEVASVDHGLRPEAAEEVALVGREARARGLPFHALKVDVAREGSLQEAARAARYEALLSLARSLGLARVAVGHHLRDQAETALLRALRGSGLEGLSGIAPARGDGVIRPLIDVSREAILAHLARFEIPSVEDPSNRDEGYARVRIRAQLLPALVEEDPRALEHLAALADEAREVSRHLAAELAPFLHQARGERLPLSLFSGCPPALHGPLLTRWLERELGVRLGRSHREGAAAVLRAGGELWLPGGARLTRGAGALALARSPEGERVARNNN